MVKKVLGAVLLLVGLTLIGAVVLAMIRQGAGNLIGTVAISAAGLAAILLGAKMIREKKAPAADEQ